jgi:DNA-binding NtrC family response regulator
MRKRILSTSRNSTVLRTRNLVLQSGGYEVVTTRAAAEFLQLFADQTFNAVVIGDSIELDERVGLAGKCRKLKPHVPLIIFVRTPAEAQQLLSYAHSLVASLDGPERLLAAVQAAVGEESGEPRRPPEA